MVLTGSFSEYPLFLLLEILLHKRETGLLEVSSPKQSGYFYIKNGEIKDGNVCKLTGAAAVELAGSFVDASFQFKPLEPTDYARVVWEKSFGPNRLVADTPDISVDAFRTMLKQFLSYAEAAYGILEGVVVSSAQRTLRRLLFYAPASYHSLEKAVVSIARRISAHATAANEFSKRAQVRRKQLQASRKALAERQIARRRNKEITLKYSHALSFQGALALIRKRAAMLPSLQQVVQSNISFGVIMVALLVGMAVTISSILRSNQDHVDTLSNTDGKIGIQSQAQLRHVSRERAKRKPRTGRQRPTEKKRDAGLAQEPEILPQSSTAGKRTGTVVVKVNQPNPN